MNQMVNFYEKLEPEKTIPKDILLTWLIWSVVVLGYVVWSWVLLSGKSDLKAELGTWQKSNQALENQLKQAEMTVDRSGLIAVQDKLSRLRKHYQGQQRLIENLSATEFVNTEGFSKVMVGLANQHREGLTVEKFELTENGQVFSMSGQVLSAEDVPAYVVRLGDEQAFQAMAFDKVEIEAAKFAMNFTVRSLAGR